MFRLALTFIAISAGLASPATAEGLGGFAATALAYDFPEGAPPMLSALPVGPVAVGGLPVLLERTTLALVNSTFGGSVQEGRDADGNAYSFACYDLKNRTLWFRSDGATGSDAAVASITVENGTAEPGWNCEKAPDSLDTISFGIPGLGAPLEEVSARLGSSPADAQGRFGYVSETPGDEAAAGIVRQTIIYEVANGTIDAISVTQKTSE